MPILPKPIIPNIFPLSSVPIKSSLFQLNFFTLSTALGTFLIKDRINAHVCSAVGVIVFRNSVSPFKDIICMFEF